MHFKKIGVVTGTRAEYGILKPLIKKIDESPHFDLFLYVTGMHLLKKFGYTIKDIQEDGFKITDVIEMYDDKDASDDRYFGLAFSRAVSGFTEALHNHRPDLLIVLGDRLEPFAAVIVAALQKIPIAHLHGGEKIDSGHIDDSIRHAITRFAHIHFPATQESAKRLEKMGEEKWRIFPVGSLSVDYILSLKKIPKYELAKEFGFDEKEDYIVCVFHPVHTEEETIGKQMNELLSTLEMREERIVVIYPNNDRGSDKIIREIEKRRENKKFIILKNLKYEKYISLLSHAKLLIGNTSSGIIEAPALYLPFVHVGTRNMGREHSCNVIFVPPEKDKIMAAIEKASSSDFKEQIKNCKNPYGEGNTASKILRIIETLDVSEEKLLKKKITY